MGNHTIFQNMHSIYIFILIFFVPNQLKKNHFLANVKASFVLFFLGGGGGGVGFLLLFKLDDKRGF